MAKQRLPVIHVYGERGNWTYSLELPVPGGGAVYDHHFNKAFRTAAAAKQHAVDHIGKPDYGGDLQTVEGWRQAIVKIHKQGWEPAGIYALGPNKAATKMNPRSRRRNQEDAPNKRAFVGAQRKDGKYPVQLVYPLSGRRISKLMTADQVDRLRSEGYDVFGSSKHNPRRTHSRNGMPEVSELFTYMSSTSSREVKAKFDAIVANLARKAAAGKYDPAKAPKLWLYLADTAARAYTREHDAPGTKGFGIFTATDRRDAAKRMARWWEDNTTIKVNPAGRGTFAKCVKAVSRRGGTYDPRAVCAAGERRKYGKRRFARMAMAGRRRRVWPASIQEE
jgi:hypothetical protein